MTLYLNESQIRPLFRMEELIPAMERMLIVFSVCRFARRRREGIGQGVLSLNVAHTH